MTQWRKKTDLLLYWELAIYSIASAATTDWVVVNQPLKKQHCVCIVSTIVYRQLTCCLQLLRWEANKCRLKKSLQNNESEFVKHFGKCFIFCVVWISWGQKIRWKTAEKMLEDGMCVSRTELTLFQQTKKSYDSSLAASRAVLLLPCSDVLWSTYNGLWPS